MEPQKTQPSAAEALHCLLASNHEICEFLNELAKLAASHIVGSQGAVCGILLSRNKRVTVVGHSNQMANEPDDGPVLAIHSLLRGHAVYAPRASFNSSIARAHR